MLCGIHNAEMKLIPAGVSKKTGRPYNAFYACPVPDCKWRPQEAPAGVGWPAVREQVAARVAPEKAVMTKEDWEAKEARTNRNILLQVAFKASVAVQCTMLPLLANGKSTMVGDEAKVSDLIFKNTLHYHSWLLSQMNGGTAADSIQQKAILPPPADVVAQANSAIEDEIASRLEY